MYLSMSKWQYLKSNSPEDLPCVIRGKTRTIFLWSFSDDLNNKRSVCAASLQILQLTFSDGYTVLQWSASESKLSMTLNGSDRLCSWNRYLYNQRFLIVMNDDKKELDEMYRGDIYIRKLLYLLPVNEKKKKKIQNITRESACFSKLWPKTEKLIFINKAIARLSNIDLKVFFSEREG